MLRIACVVALLALLPAVRAADFDHSHAVWDGVLQAHVRGGLVDYPALQADRSALDAYLAALAAPTADAVAAWTADQQKAYYINAYNACTVAAIIDAWPVKSIRDIDGVWKVATHRVAGADLTLDQIEHDRLRPPFQDYRIHAAINCASIGCPPLHDHAYTAAGLDAQLDAAMARLVAHPKSFQFDPKQKTLGLTWIVNWFAADFAGTPGFATAKTYGAFAGSVNALVAHAPAPTQAAIAKTKPKLHWLDYDWSINLAPARK